MPGSSSKGRGTTIGMVGILDKCGRQRSSLFAFKDAEVGGGGGRENGREGGSLVICVPSDFQMSPSLVKQNHGMGQIHKKSWQITSFTTWMGLEPVSSPWHSAEYPSRY